MDTDHGPPPPPKDTTAADRRFRPIATIQHQAGTIEQLRLELEKARGSAAQERDITEKIRGNLAKSEIRLESVGRLEGDVVLLREKIEMERDSRIKAEKEAIALKSRLDAFKDMGRKN